MLCEGTNRDTLRMLLHTKHDGRACDEGGVYLHRAEMQC